MAGTFIPPSDAAAAAFIATMAAALTLDPTAYGLVAGDATALSNASNAFAAALADSVTISASATAAVTASRVNLACLLSNVCFSRREISLRKN